MFDLAREDLQIRGISASFSSSVTPPTEAFLGFPRFHCCEDVWGAASSILPRLSIMVSVGKES